MRVSAIAQMREVTDAGVPVEYDQAEGWPKKYSVFLGLTVQISHHLWWLMKLLVMLIECNVILLRLMHTSTVVLLS